MLIKEPIHKKTKTEKTVAKNLFSNFVQHESSGILDTEENKAFLSIISHNIKNPFGALLGYSDLLQEDFSDLCEAEKILYVSEMKKTAEYTYKYFDRFFEWMYYKTGKYTLNNSQLNVREVITNSVKKVLKETNFLGEIKFNIDAELEIYSDAASLIKAIYYILENAATYSPKNGIIEIIAKGNDDFLEISIKDSGSGISTEKLNKLFDVSKNLVPNSEGKENSTGLGLILVNEIMKLNNGSVNIKNNCDLGTLVCIRLQKNTVIN